MEPGTSPTVFETLAVTGGTPRATRVGNVMSVPDPTTVLMRPAARPARRMAAASSRVTAWAAPGCHPRCWGGDALSGSAAVGRSGWAALAASAMAASTALFAWVSSLSVRLSRCDGSLLPMSTRVFGPSTSLGMPRSSFIVEPSPSSALPISLGTIQSLLAPPSAILGIICRYW